MTAIMTMMYSSQKSAVNENRAKEANDANRHNNVNNDNAPKKNDEILKEVNSANTNERVLFILKRILTSYMNFVYIMKID